jgi:hypothetical protein
VLGVNEITLRLAQSANDQSVIEEILIALAVIVIVIDQAGDGFAIGDTITNACHSSDGRHVDSEMASPEVITKSRHSRPRGSQQAEKITKAPVGGGVVVCNISRAAERRPATAEYAQDFRFRIAASSGSTASSQGDITACVTGGALSHSLHRMFV